MSNYDNTNKGAIWKNDKKDTDKHPDFRGDVNVEGTEYWVAAWKRGPNDNPKAPALKFALTAKDQQSAPKPEPDGGDDFSDDVPF